MIRRQMRYKLDDAIGNPGDWSYTWDLRDDVSFGTTCGFCGQKEQRLSYEIRRGEDTRWVCQRCVGRYAFGGVVAGESLTPHAAREHVHALSARLKQRSCQNIIRDAHAGSDDPALLEMAAYFDRNLQLSPRHAASLFVSLKEMDEAIDIRIFDIQARSKACHEEFGALDEAEKTLLWPALSPQQRRRIVSLGYAPRSVRPVRRQAEHRQPYLSYH